jgi:LysR family nitrogen assimilation transcriptional regulator
MDIRFLEYFLRVAELGSINRAAADLHLSQPALSRHISALEGEMGVKLFVRTQGGVNLTESGKLLSDRARPLLRQFTTLKEQVGEKAAGQLAIGIPPSWQKVFTSEFASRTVDEFPAISLRVYEGVSHILREQMFAGLLDLSIVPFDSSPSTGYRQIPLVREPLILVGSRDEKLDVSEPAPINRLDGVKLVLPGRTNALRGLVEHSLVRKGMTFRLAVETDTLSLCLEMARKGAGLTVVPACTLYENPNLSEVSWTPMRGMYLTWTLCENPARMHSQAVREGRRLVMSVIRDALATKDWYGASSVGNALSK